MGGYRYELPDQDRWFHPAPAERFDRIAFARRALRLLGPGHFTVVFYPSSYRLRLRQGRDFGRYWEARWALMGIPPHASREQIALCLVELVRGESAPGLVEWLLEAAGREPT